MAHLMDKHRAQHMHNNIHTNTAALAAFRKQNDYRKSDPIHRRMFHRIVH